MIVRPVLCRPFVGRRDELAYLRERRREAGSSRGGLVLIAGEAGVGKSRLIAEFCGALAYSRWRIAHGPCTEFARRPYGPILDLLARLDPGGFQLAPAESKRQQLDAIVERIAAVAARKAVILVVEDLHWADAATLDLLAHLGPKLPRMRALVLASFRPDDLHPEHPATAGLAKIARAARAGRIDLAPFAGVELRTFIDEALSGFALPDATRRAVALAGEGNPFFTEELLKSAVERGGRRADGRTKRELPATVKATLLERLRPFDEDERRIVTQAAVIGRTFRVELLAATLGREPHELLPALRRARDFQLVEELAPMVFRFRHGLTREAIYGDFLGSEVRPLHRAIALALENAGGEPPLEGLAYHWWAAGDGPRTLRYNDLAGDAAVRVHAHEDAIAFYERALDANAIDEIARGSLLEKIAERRIALGLPEEGYAVLQTAADVFREAGAHDREAGTRSNAAIMAYMIGLPEPAAALEAMLERLDAAEYVARSRAHLGMAWLTATLGFPTTAGRHLDGVDARALDAPDIALRFHNVAAFVAMLDGDLERFRGEYVHWVAGARASGTLRALTAAHVNGAQSLAFFGLHEEAREELERARRLAAEARMRQTVEGCDAFGALCDLLRGDLRRVREQVEAISPSTDNHVNATMAKAWGTLAGAYLDDAALIATWFDAVDLHADRKMESECGAGYAEIMARRGRLDEAAEMLHRTLPDCEVMRGNVFTLLAYARYARPADRDRARAYLVRAASGPSETVEHPALALFDGLVALREGRVEAAREPALAAAEGFRRLRAPLLEAAALEAAGDRHGALALFRRCGATYDVRRLSGETAPAVLAAAVAASGSAELADALSAREREIAVLAGRGQSNLEIARDLAISHKTVEKHLGSAFQKLGVSSRRQLRSLVPAEG